MPPGLGLGEFVAAAACGGILQGLCRPVPECRCACHFEKGPDHSVLELLREQLQRCGPEHLTVPTTSSAECPDLTGLLSATALLFLCLGVLLGFGIQFGTGVRSSLLIDNMSPEQQQQAFLSQLLLLLGSFVILCLLIF